MAEKDLKKKMIRLAARKKAERDDSESHMIENPSLASKIINIVIVIICGLIAFCAFIPMWHVLMSSISDMAAGRQSYLCGI